jgi:hypothetical protein
VILPSGGEVLKVVAMRREMPMEIPLGEQIAIQSLTPESMLLSSRTVSRKSMQLILSHDLMVAQLEMHMVHTPHR